MLVTVGIFAGVFALCAVFAFAGAQIGAKMENKNLGAGIIEESMKSSLLSASWLGMFLGVVPFLVFVTILIVMALSMGHERSASDAAAQGSSAATAAP